MTVKKDLQAIKDTLTQVEEGEITFIEFVRACLKSISKEDVDDHNHCAHHKCSWPVRRDV